MLPPEIVIKEEFNNYHYSETSQQTETKSSFQGCLDVQMKPDPTMSITKDLEANIISYQQPFARLEPLEDIHTDASEIILKIYQRSIFDRIILLERMVGFLIASGSLPVSKIWQYLKTEQYIFANYLHQLNCTYGISMVHVLAREY